jgi:hypothetical protein
MKNCSTSWHSLAFISHTVNSKESISALVGKILVVASADAVREPLLWSLKRRPNRERLLDAWMKTFGFKDPEETKNLNRRIIAIVREKEEYERLRIRDGKPIVGRDQLTDMPLDCEYEPQKLSKRVAYILWIKKLLKEARDVRERSRVGDYSVP